MTLNPNATATGRFLDFPTQEETTDTQRIFAEYAILGGMLKGLENYIRRGASVDWSHPMSEAISRACVSAWEYHGWDSDEQWRNAVSAWLVRYAGRSPLLDPDMYHWVFYLMGIYDYWREGVLQDAEREQEAGL